MRRSVLPVLILVLLSSPVPGAPPGGAVEGTFEPADATAEVSALRDGTVVATVRAGGRDKPFRIDLTPGTYTIVVSAPASSFPVRLEGVEVKAGATTSLPPILIMPGSGRAVLEGRVVPARPDSEITLLAEGKERASARTDREGRYEFRSLPAGAYEVRASAPGHAVDVSPVVLPENQRVRQTQMLLPVVALDGVDWAAGKVRAAGIGHPPQNAGNAAASRAMTQRAAVADAQRNLLRTVEQITIDGGRTVGSLMKSGTGAVRIQGYLKGFTIVSERDLGDGRIEVILELPLTGPSGLSRFLAE